MYVVHRAAGRTILFLPRFIVFMYNHFHTYFLLLHFTLRSSEPDCVGNIQSVSFSVLSKYIGVLFLQVNLLIFLLIKTENTTQG